VSWPSRCAACGGDYLQTACDCGATVLGDVGVDAVVAAAEELLDLPVREPAPL